MHPAAVERLPSPPHALEARDLAAALGTDPTRGLAPAEAAERLARHGPNTLPEPEARSLLAVFFGQFKSPLIYLLFLAAAIALSLREIADAAVIFTVVLLNAVIGAVQEGRAERSLKALRKLTESSARVVRGGTETTTPARALVPGDVILLAAGDAVPADARLIEAAAIEADESALTGESLPIEKHTAPLPEDTRLAERQNLLHAGTNVVAGRARAVVFATGPDSEVGRIAELTGGAVEPKTPLEARIDRFGRALLVAAAGLFVLVSVVGLVRGIALADIAMIAISQVVGMVPEGLPVAMTIALAVGVQRMAKRRAIVRRLAAVETLGSITVICSDKTGTLTKNEMTVMRVVLPSGAAYDVTGVGYAPVGELRRSGERVVPAPGSDLYALLEASVLCNDADLMVDAEGAHRVLGDPTEGALLTLASKAGLEPQSIRSAAPRSGEIPFSSQAKRMATEHDRDEVPFLAVKGGPEAVLPLCGLARIDGNDTPLTEEIRGRIEAAITEMGRNALRVLCLAIAPERRAEDGLDGEGPDMVLLGLVGELDPPRDEAKEAIVRCRSAGIRPIMITGDHRDTAIAIARSLGLLDEGGRAIDGAELARMSDDDLTRAVPEVSVFSRVEPADKLRIVAALQARGEICAMTGDGVNDAPALARADVGVAMGQSGTDVAKQAAKVVVTDDNFASIVAAVEEGRVVFANLRKVLLLLLSTSIAEVAVLTFAMLAGYPPPFVAVQILWNNLVTEGVITVNLVLEPPEGDELRRPPNPKEESLVTGAMLHRILLMTAAITVSTLGWFVYRLDTGIPFEQARAEAFTTLAVCEWFNVLSCRSATRSALSTSVFKNRFLVAGLLAGNLLQVAVIYVPAMNELFYTQAFDLVQVLSIGLVASLVLWVEELRKLLVRRRATVSG